MENLAPSPSRIARTLAAAAGMLVGLTMSATVTGFAWDELPPLPPSAGQKVQPGMAGPFVGVHGPALLVGGGANFPDKMPWDGGAKVWWDDLWVLERKPDGALNWVADKRFSLPRRLGYGVSVSMPDGVVIVGGHDAERCYAEVYLLSWDAKAREVRRTELPPMPQPLTFMAGALVGQTLYVAGGQHAMKGGAPTSVFWALDLSQRGNRATCKWVELPPWPGPARVLPVAAAQRLNGADAFFLFSGRAAQPGRKTEIFTDAYVYEPAKRSWRALQPVGGEGLSVMAGTAVPLGADEIAIFGGDRGDLFLELEAHDLAIEELRRRREARGLATDARTAIERDIEHRLQAKRKIYDTHPGFAREVLAYHVSRGIWRVVTRAPVAAQVTTTAVTWDGAIVIPSGEIKPGVRTPAVVRAKPVTH